jgi:hypothetical protein
MADRPTLHLTNLASRGQHGPGAKLCAMANPPWWARGDGKVGVAAPFLDDLLDVQARRIGIEEYAERCRLRWLYLDGLGRFAPGALVSVRREDKRAVAVPVADGDTLFCACARPDSPKRTHPCHIEWLAPFLVRAGWRVVLYGEKVNA